MAYKAYLSEIAPWWTIERQEELLSGAVPGWPPGVGVFIDRLTVRQRRAHQVDALTQRTSMLRPTSRASMGKIYVASLAVLAWGETDFRAVLEATRKATLHAVSDGVTIPPGQVDADEMVQQWQAARTKSRLQGAALVGAAVSAAKRSAIAAEGVAKIKDRWPLPSSEWSTAALLAEAGVSRNTVNAHLGGRETAQARYQAALKRKASREKKNG